VTSVRERIRGEDCDRATISEARPALSVIMAFYNDAPYIAESIESILNQTYRDFEFVIINDASTDGSREIVARYSDARIRLLDNPSNLGLARSLNLGLAAARGDLVARLDANDVSHTDRLEKQMRFMREHPEIALLGGQYEAIDTRGYRLPWAAVPKPVTELGVKWYFLFESPFVHSTVMFRKALVDELGGYDPTFQWAPSEDAELWARMAVRHRMVNLPETLISQRYDPKSISHDISRPDRAQASFVPRLTQFLAVNMKRGLALDDAEEWAGLVAALFTNELAVTNETLQRYVEAVDAMERRLIEIHPEAARNTDVRRGKVELLARALFRLAPRSRRSSVPVFLRMLRAHPQTALRQLPKYVAMGLLGSRARSLWRWWRQRQAVVSRDKRFSEESK